MTYDPTSLSDMLEVRTYLQTEMFFALRQGEIERVREFKRRLKICENRICILRMTKKAA